MEEETDVIVSRVRKAQDAAKHSRYTKYFPFEVVFLLFQLSERLYVFLYQQYYFQRVTRDHLATLGNYTGPNSSICLNQSYVVQFTGNATFLRLQERVNSLNLYTEVTFYGLSAISTLLLGSLSDALGRKPILCLGMTGAMLMGVVNLVVVYFDVDIEYYLLTAVFYGGMGGFSAMLATTIAAVLDTTASGHWVVIRLSVVEACVGVSRALTSVTGNNWTQAIGCNFLPPAWLLLGIGMGGLGFCLLTAESHPRSRRRGSKTSGVRQIINGIKMYSLPRCLGLQKWTLLWIASLIICSMAVAVAAEVSILNFFLHNKPLQWSYDTIGIFGAVQSTCIGASLVLLLPLLVMLGCSDTAVCFMGGVVGVVSSLLMGLLTVDWAVYLGEETLILCDILFAVVGCIQGFMLVGYPATRSYIAKLTTDSKGY